MRNKLFAVVAAIACVASPLSAQDWSITPFIGTMIPLNNMITDTAGLGYFRNTEHTTFGLRLSKQMTPGLALQIQGGIGQGEFEGLSGGVTQVKFKSSVYFADLRARLRVMGGDATNLGLIVGAGWTQFKNGYFDVAHAQDEDNAMVGRVTGIVGVGVKAHLTGSASFTADLTDRIHEQSVEAPVLPAGVIKPMQHDLSVSFGLSFPLGD